MTQLFLLTKDNTPLAAQEILSLIDDEFQITENLLITDSNFKDYDRLAYTKRVYDLLFIAYKHNLEKKMQEFNWKKIYKKDFALRNFNSNLEEKELAGFIWDNLKNPKVNLKNPKTEIHIIKKGSKFFCCLLKKQLKQEFESRKAHLRPALHPTSLHPRLARALVNITGIEKGELLDPFCGTGGILIEAGIIKLKPIGYDISPIMIERSKKNLDYYKIKDYKLEKKNALTIKDKFDYVVTDLPYGLNTKSTDLSKLYDVFLHTLQKILGKKAVVVFPNFINYKKIIKNTKLKIISEFDYYIHKSLTKKIVLLSKQ